MKAGRHSSLLQPLLTEKITAMRESEVVIEMSKPVQAGTAIRGGNAAGRRGRYRSSGLR